MKGFIKKLLIFISLFSILFLSFSLVSASDEVNGDLIINNSCFNHLDDGLDSGLGVSVLDDGLDSGLGVSVLDDGFNYKSKLKSSFKEESILSDGTFKDIQIAIDNAKEKDEIILDGIFLSDGNHIVINKTLTITGSSNTILDANNLSKIILVEADNVNLNNLHFINGKSRDDSDFGPYQGTINWQGSNGSVINCSFINNSGDEKSYGASIFWKGSNGQIENSDFINSYSGANGGAIFALGDNLTINNSRFISNHGSEGGAIYFGGSAPMQILNSVFINNSADLGGAIAACAMGRTVLNSSFINNSAENGGAISWCGSNGLIDGSTFINNSAEFKGGSIVFTGSNNLVKNSRFINNSAYDGGAIHSYNKVNYINSLIFDNNEAVSEKDCYGDLEFKRFDSFIIANDMVTTAIDSKIDGRVGKYFNVSLTDGEGNLLANRSIKIGFNGKIYNRTTDSNGQARLQINLKYSDIYTFAICFLSDNDYYASFAVSKITVKLQKPVLSVKNYRYSSSTKSKSISAVLKTNNGNPLSGKTVIFNINNKVYTAKTNSNGLAVVNVSLHSKKTYGFSVKYAGDDTYSSIIKYNSLVVY